MADGQGVYVAGLAQRGKEQEARRILLAIHEANRLPAETGDGEESD